MPAQYTQFNSSLYMYHVCNLSQQYNIMYNKNEVIPSATCFILLGDNYVTTHYLWRVHVFSINVINPCSRVIEIWTLYGNLPGRILQIKDMIY